MIHLFAGRQWIFNLVVMGSLLGIIYFGVEFAFDQGEAHKVDTLRQDTRDNVGKWNIEKGFSKRFDDQPFIMASANSALLDGDHFYDLSLICYYPGDVKSSLWVLVYKVTITSQGLTAYPLSSGASAELIMTRDGTSRTLKIEYAAASEALEAHVLEDRLKFSNEMFGSYFSKEIPLSLHSKDGTVEFIDSSASENLIRNQILDACSSKT